VRQNYGPPEQSQTIPAQAWIENCCWHFSLYVTCAYYGHLFSVRPASSVKNVQPLKNRSSPHSQEKHWRNSCLIINSALFSVTGSLSDIYHTLSHCLLTNMLIFLTFSFSLILFWVTHHGTLLWNNLWHGRYLRMAMAVLP
jgi:hypothetical protein